MKGKSEPMFREGLGEVDLPLVIYKPPDDARNWKPCDFMVWGRWRGPLPADETSLHSAWFEAKEARSSTTFPLPKELRPSQRGGIRDAASVGIPYWLAIWWPERSVWTISRALPLLELDRSMTFSELSGKYGIDATQRNLASTLRLVLDGEV